MVSLYRILFCLYSEEEVQDDLDFLLGTDMTIQKRSAALFLLKLKESKRLSQVAIDDIVQEWDGLFSHTVRQLQANVRAKLAAAGVDYRDVEGLPEIFDNVTSPFQELQTRYMQEKYYREFLGLVVSYLLTDLICETLGIFAVTLIYTYTLYRNQGR